MRQTRSSLQPEPGIVAHFHPSDRLAFYFLLLALVVQLFFVLHFFSQFFVVESPVRGGVLHEGIVGGIPHRNPLHTTNPREEALSALLHAGLLRHTRTGTLSTRLADSWTQEGDGLFVFRIRDDAAFHDGFPVTARDVAHTVALLRERDADPHAPWHGVQAEPIGERTVAVTVPEGNHAFPDAFTVPILPEHIWRKIPSDRRKTYRGSGAHIGAGPFRYLWEDIQDVDRTERIVLAPFPSYVHGRPYLERVVLHLFQSTADLVRAYRDGTINAMHGIAPSDIVQRDDTTLYTADTDRLFGIFFNTEDGRILQNALVRSVLSRHVDRDRIVDDIFLSRATAIQSPLPSDTAVTKRDTERRELEQALDDIGWTVDPETGIRTKGGVPARLVFAVPDIGDLRSTARVVADGWKEIGIDTGITTLPPETMRDAIREGKFDAILYGYWARKPTDLISLWKSSDAVNIAAATNFGSQTLNTLLTELGRDEPPKRFSTASSDRWRSLVYDEVKAEMLRSVPAVFLYSPHFLFVLPATIKGAGTEGTSFGRITDSGSRFADVHQWHIRRERVWRIVQKYQDIFNHGNTAQKSRTDGATAVF